MTNATYTGEAQLANFGETARKGRYVEFYIDEIDGTERHPFYGLGCGRENGQFFKLVAVPIGDDDQPMGGVKSERSTLHSDQDSQENAAVSTSAALESALPAKTPFHQMPRAKQAGIRCKEAEFQHWLHTTKDWADGAVVPNDPEGSAAQWVRDYCKVISRAELNDHGLTFAHGRWDAVEDEYRQATGRMAEDR